jgi:hypothetical protein
MRSTLPLLLLPALSVVTGCAWIPRSVVARADHSAQTRYTLVEGSPLYDLIPRGWIAPVNAPRFSSVADAASFMEDDEPVLVVALGDDVRLYSTWYLDGHEVVNDVIDGRPVAVTWCPLVQAGVAFDRQPRLDGRDRPLTLQASGKLWRDALVMVDRQTGSLWTQHDGRALRGPARDEGAQLTSLPSTHTTWAVARARYPGGRVLDKKGDLLGAGRSTIYDDYLARTDQLGIFGTHLADDALPGKTLVFGFVRPESAYALSVPGLQARGGAAMSVGGDPVFAHALPGGRDARVWLRAPPDRRVLYDLELDEARGLVVDPGRGLAWDAVDGSPREGDAPALQGVHGTVVYYFAWQQNHPDGRVWGGEGGPG